MLLKSRYHSSFLRVDHPHRLRPCLESLESRHLLTAVTQVSASPPQDEALYVAAELDEDITSSIEYDTNTETQKRGSKGKGKGGNSGGSGEILISPIYIHHQHQTAEDGTMAEFEVVLDSEPSANVTVDLNVSDTSEGSLNVTSLIFTPTNWNVAQTVTVTGVDDGEIDGDVTYAVITAPAESTDPRFAGVDPADVTVVNLDDDDGLSNVIYIRNIWVEEGTLGKHVTHQFFVEIVFDTNGNGIADDGDEPASGANVAVGLYNATPTDLNSPQNIRNFLTQFDEEKGAHKTSGIRGLEPGTYYLEINELYFNGYFWDPDDELHINVDDDDEDSLPDYEFIVQP